MKVSGRKLLSYFALAVAILVLTQVIPYFRDRDRIGLTGDFRDRFIRGFSRSCVADPASADVPKPILENYCTCFAKGTADRMSKRLASEVQANPQNASELLKAEIEASYPPCAEEKDRALAAAK
jgi:hypothetical protein